MPVHAEPGSDDREIARYLLGLLPDEETERLDEASIADDEFAARLRIAEADLVDSYVRGMLDADMVKRFESHYLASPRRKCQVRFAAGFLRAVDRSAADEAEAAEGGTFAAASRTPAAPSPAPQPGPMAMPSRLAPRLMAVAAVLVVASGILIFRAVRPGDRSTITDSDMVASDRGPAQRELLHDPRGPLVLMPQTRAVERVPALDIPAGADAAAFELRLDSNDFSRYEVRLVDPASNRVVWRSEPIAAASTNNAPVISVTVPVRVLRPQHYSLAVVGRAAGRTEVVGSYAFEVSPR
jgi:hypothetical protein